MSKPDTRRVGEVVGGKYRVVRFLAAGGMGVVYEAQHTVVGRRFAVKFLRPDLAERRESLTRFQREAQTAGALESENVTAAVDFGIASDGSPYIVMEYLVGESLEAVLARERRLPPGRATDLVVQAARGVQAAHASGIVHRDLKPQNLFVCRREDGTDLLKILDFGIVKLEAADQTSTATRTGTVLGTPAYMSPEQARGEKGIDQRADVYALGAILYELLSGEKPHPGDSHNATLHHISTQPAVPLATVASDLQRALVEVVESALASNPEARPASAEAFGQALAPFARREVWPSAPPSRPLVSFADPSSTLLAPGAAADGGASPDRSLRAAPEVPGTQLRRRTLAALAVGLAAAAALVIGGRWPHRDALEPGRDDPRPLVERDDRKEGARDVPTPPAATGRAGPVAPLELGPTTAEPVLSTKAPVARAPTAPTAHHSGNVVERRTSPASSASMAPHARAGGQASGVPVTFDQQNPYN